MLALAGAKTRAFDAESLRKLLRCAHSGEKSRAGRCYKFAARLRDPERQSMRCRDIRYRGNRYRQNAVLAANRARALGDGFDNNI